MNLYFEYTWHGVPVPFKEPQICRNRLVMNPVYRAFKERLAADLEEAWGYYSWDLPEPGTKEWKKHIQTVRYGMSLMVYRVKDSGDKDNYTKPVQDCLQKAGIIANDKQIIDSFEPYGLRIDKKNPRLEIKLYRIPKPKEA